MLKISGFTIVKALQQIVKQLGCGLYEADLNILLTSSENYSKYSMNIAIRL